MQIERIHTNGYNDRGGYSSGQKGKDKARKRLKKPIDAITIDKLQIEETKKGPEDQYAWLRRFVKELPEEDVAYRIKKMVESYDDIEDCIVDKLIMEEL